MSVTTILWRDGSYIHGLSDYKVVSIVCLYHSSKLLHHQYQPHMPYMMMWVSGTHEALTSHDTDNATWRGIQFSWHSWIRQREWNIQEKSVSRSASSALSNALTCADFALTRTVPEHLKKSGSVEADRWVNNWKLPQAQVTIHHHTQHQVVPEHHQAILSHGMQGTITISWCLVYSSYLSWWKDAKDISRVSCKTSATSSIFTRAWPKRWNEFRGIFILYVRMFCYYIPPKSLDHIQIHYAVVSSWIQERTRGRHQVQYNTRQTIPWTECTQGDKEGRLKTLRKMPIITGTNLHDREHPWKTIRENSPLNQWAYFCWSNGYVTPQIGPKHPKKC